MNIIEDGIGGIILNALWKLLKVIGTLIRWPFLSSKLNVEEIYQQNLSGVIGMVFLGAAITFTFLLS
ncbi:hypothetical protein [Flavobacterium humi]|uniref:Uncharacterized protein n=1 Tax=Flavobacterium humi TaxID=2562683 RepID=A0A4Z0LD45_9FLAO|nr:hypothetical protein [Flavobacterium humi]TGD59801.1 hypothetical protein E4635_02405 [Flavobacterium humi]